METIRDNKELTSKILDALDEWAVTFKVIGFPRETPRYSQLMKHEGKFYLISTQKSTLMHEIKGLTEEENDFIDEMDHNQRWNEYKEMRTRFLLDNHPTIDVY
jgi:hypothetical protein